MQFQQQQQPPHGQGHLLQTISGILEEIVKETDLLPMETQTSFHAPKPPSISILNYVQRIAKYTHCSDPCFVIALIYLDRLQEKHADLILNSHCIHRFVMVSVMVAIKYQDDDYYKNEYYAKVGGISLREINQLEMEFLDLLSFELYIEKQQYETYEKKLHEYGEQDM